jgi:hypothetical protein
MRCVSANGSVALPRGTSLNNTSAYARLLNGFLPAQE